MDFLSDLFDSDESLSTAVATDPTVKAMIETAARDGNVSVLRLAVQNHQVGPDLDESIALAVVNVLGDQLRPERIEARDRQERLDFLDAWIAATTPPGPQAKQDRLDKMLAECFKLFPNTSDEVASRLVFMGADPLRNLESPRGADLAGSRLGLTETMTTPLAMAVYANSRVAPALAKQFAAEGQTVAVIERATPDGGSIKAELDTVAYAIAIAETRQLADLIRAMNNPGGKPGAAATRGNPGTPGVAGSQKATLLSESIGKVLDLGLHEFGMDEVHHGIGLALASGAIFPDKPTAKRFLDATVTVVDSPSLMTFASDGKVLEDGKAPSGTETSLRKLTLASSLIQCPDPKVVIGAFASLALQGWDVNAPAGGPPGVAEKRSTNANANASETEASKPIGSVTVAHYAALRGDVSIIEALKELKADLNAVDSKGVSVADYAGMGLNPRCVKAIDPDAVVKTSKAQAQEPEYQEHLASVPYESSSSTDGLSPTLPGDSALPQEPDDDFFAPPEGAIERDATVSSGSPAIGAEKGGIRNDYDDVNDALAAAAEADAKEQGADPLPPAAAVVPLKTGGGSAMFAKLLGAHKAREETINAGAATFGANPVAPPPASEMKTVSREASAHASAALKPKKITAPPSVTASSSTGGSSSPLNSMAAHRAEAAQQLLRSKTELANNGKSESGMLESGTGVASTPEGSDAKVGGRKDASVDAETAVSAVPAAAPAAHGASKAVFGKRRL